MNSFKEIISKNRIKVFICVSVLYILVCGFHCYKAIDYSYKYKQFKEEAVKVLDFENRLFDVNEWKFNLFDWGGSEFDNKMKIFNKGAIEADICLKNSYHQCLYFIIDTILFILLVFLLYFRRQDFLKIISFSIIIVALMSLCIGVFAPVLEISAFKSDLSIEVPLIKITKTFSGDMYFYYQCKSVFNLIVLLFSHKNFVVGISILLFSVLFPLTKLTISFMVLWKPELYQRRVINFVIQKIGKWSMADVFVAAAFLSYLSFNNMNTGIQTASHTMIGLYFFFTYCILSLISSHLIEKVKEIREKAINLE